MIKTEIEGTRNRKNKKTGNGKNKEYKKQGTERTRNTKNREQKNQGIKRTGNRKKNKRIKK